jgi:homogentisate 1,2-dioxygenase
MPYYTKLGKIPPKRHTVCRQANGELHAEHLMGSLGFGGPASLLYHIHQPTSVLATRKLMDLQIEADPGAALRMRHFRLGEVPAAGSPTLDRTPVLFNADVTLSMARPRGADDFWYRNAQADEIVYIGEGKGSLESEYGVLSYAPGDYVVIPRGILHRFLPDAGETRLFIIETPSHVRVPTRYLSAEGQFLEHAPFCERDIHGPAELHSFDEAGEHRIIVKQSDVLTEVTLDHHPLDVVGWDGCYYPWKISIHDFEPITGSIHQPPPVHQQFQADQFVVCSFVPRLFDFHPEAVPAPYSHSNVMSDEVLYYANDEFMSRSGISTGSLTHHPMGLPHGPQPGRTEASIGAKETKELAVMVDTFRPLQAAKAAGPFEDESYERSWLGA